MLRFGIILMAAVAACPQTNRPGAQGDREQLSDMASRILERTIRARGAIDKDPAAARNYVDEALQNVTAMEIARPHAPNPFMVTLYTESVQIDVNQPTPVTNPGNTGSANRSANPPANAPANPPVVQQVEAESTRVELNVTQAKQHLEGARAALQKNDVTAAKQSLDAVDGDLKAESEVGNLPLVKARQNLAVALDDVREQHYTDAVAPLRAASSALAEASQVKAPHSKDAGRLHADIDKLAASIEQNHSSAGKKIAGWESEISYWFRPLAPPR